LVATAYTGEYYDGNGEYKLMLNQYPLNTITTLQRWDTIDNSAADTYAANTDYLFDQKAGWIYLRQGFAEGVKNYKITYNAGYGSSSGQIALPYDIRYACAQLCQFMNKFKSKPGIAGESIGTYSYSKEIKSGNMIVNGSPLPAEIAETIGRYIREDSNIGR
jgi:hypothetical protein